MAIETLILIFIRNEYRNLEKKLFCYLRNIAARYKISVHDFLPVVTVMK